jgi:hypothetical protein
MPFEPIGQSDPLANAKYADNSEPLSATGQIIGWGIYGALVLIGFAFGIVTGYERPKTIAVAKPGTDTDQTKPDTHKADTPKTTPKANPSSEPVNPQSVNATPKETPNTTPMPMTPATPKADPKTTPMPTTPTTPKVDPKPSMPATPKVDTTPKKEDLKPVSFKTDVLPVLRTHCLNCHGAAGKPKGNVDLTTIAKIMKSGDTMLVPGKPDKSDIYTSIIDLRMPKDRPKPSDKEIDILKNWILTGAKE